MTKKQEMEAARAESIEMLRTILTPGDTVYCILRHVSRSGMQREISLRVMDKDSEGKPWLRYIDTLAARAIGERIGRHDGIVMDGCGMDMGFQLVYLLSSALWPDGWKCIGNGCPSNDHSNGAPRNGEMSHRSSGYALRSEWI